MRKRLIFRSDDVGYTKTFNDGVFKGIDDGIITSADVMFDSPGTIDALQRLANYPWISIGWHRHLWNSPVLSPKEVPSLVDEDGRFKWRHKHDKELFASATYDDAYKEFVAEMELCYKYLHRYPDIANVRGADIPLEIAFKDVCDRFEIPYNVDKYKEDSPKAVNERNRIPSNIKLEDVVIISDTYNDQVDAERKFDLADFKNYHPESFTLRHRWNNENEILLGGGGHPGYLDDYILAESKCSIHRPRELQACISKEVRDFIINNKIELINTHDAIYGTNQYQQHLKEIGSDLFMLEK